MIFMLIIFYQNSYISTNIYTMSTFGGAITGEWDYANSKVSFSGIGYWFALLAVIVLLIVIAYLLWLAFDYISTKSIPAPKQGMVRLPGEVLTSNLSWNGGGEHSQNGPGGVMADPNYSAARDDAIVALSRGKSVQGLMSGRGLELPTFWSADDVNRASQSEQAKKADGSRVFDEKVDWSKADYSQGFRVNKSLQGLASPAPEVGLTDKLLQGSMYGGQLQY